MGVMNIYKIILICMCSVVVCQLHAKVNPIQADPLALVVELSLQHTDNYHPRVVEGISAYNSSVGMSGKLVSQNDLLWFQASYSGKVDQYHISQEDIDFEDTFAKYKVQLLTRFFISNSWQLDLFVDKEYQDELLGTGISSHRMGITQADSYDVKQLGGTVYYGRKQSAHHISIAYSSSEQVFDSPNFYANLFDIDKDSVGFEYTYRISKDTNFDINVEYQDIGYAAQNIPDSQLYQVLTGFEWQGTGKSKITALLGAYQRTFLLAESNQGLIWQLDAEYQASERLTLKLVTSRSSQDSTDELSPASLVSRLAGQALFQYQEHITLGAEFVWSSNEFERQQLEMSSQESMVGVSARLQMLAHSKLMLRIQKNTVEDTVLYLDYQENRVELSWLHDF
jgi:hypothetical protein